MEIQRIVDKWRRVQFSMKLRGDKLADKVLFSEHDGVILLEPYNDEKAKQPEYVEGRFGTDDRLTLPRKLSRKLGIGKVVTFVINDDGTVYIKPYHTQCLICGSTEHLHTVGNRTNLFICESCSKKSGQ